MTARIVEVDGINVPFFIYGTAWKENETSRLTRLALDTGFRGIDTANQRKHYHEAAVGEALSDVVDSGLVTREEIFLQTKFTFQAGQDDRLPYDPDAPPAEQVAQSFTSSLRNLRTDYIDSYILHGPTRRSGLQPDDWAAWRAMEASTTSTVSWAHRKFSRPCRSKTIRVIGFMVLSTSILTQQRMSD